MNRGARKGTSERYKELPGSEPPPAVQQEERPGLPRVALLVAAVAALLAGTFAGVAGFSGPSEMFFWGLGFGFLLVAVRGTRIS